jgi:hypothetical protein
VITLTHNLYVMLRSCHENSFQLNSIMPVTSTNLICTRIRCKKIDNSYCKRVEKFRYLETILTNQNSILDEIKRRMKLENAFYNSVQYLMSSSLLSKNINIKIYRTVILPVLLYGCETW